VLQAGPTINPSPGRAHAAPARLDRKPVSASDVQLAIRLPGMCPTRDPREYGLTAADRAEIAARKFPGEDAARAIGMLDAVRAPTPQVLGAILFLARPGHLADVAEYVRLANEARQRLLDAATVKDERG